MDTNVILCKWKKSQEGFRLWVKGKPKVFGEAATYEEAEDRLIDAIMNAAADLDAVIPVVPEYDPPLPASAQAEKYLRPELYLVAGDEIFELDGWLRPISLHCGEYSYHLENRKAAVQSLFWGGICQTCKSGVGGRSDVPLFVDGTGYQTDGGWIRGPFAQGIRVFSDRFLALLGADELKLFNFRPVRVSKKVKREYFECYSTDRVPFVGVKGLDTDGIECRDCGTICCYSIDEPILQCGGVFIDSFICRSDLPDPLPSCFPIGIGSKTGICMTRDKWDEVRGHKHAKGIASRELGVVSNEQAERKPRLRTHFDRCDSCRKWYKPCDLNGRTRYAFDYPSDADEKVWNADCLEWLRKATRGKDITVVREIIPLEELIKKIGAGTKVKQHEFVSFRCNNCYRLGRIIIAPKRLIFSW